MKILVTGAAGFIGASLSSYLKNNGHTIFGMDNFSKNSPDGLYEDHNKEFIYHMFSRQDIREIKFFPKDIDCVIHLAAISSLADCQSNPQAAYSNNVLGTINLLEKCREEGISNIVFASTNAVLENCVKMNESHSLIHEPDLVYPMTKRACENLCIGYNRNYGMDIKILRFANVYGPRQSTTRKHPPLLGYITHCLENNIKPTFYSKDVGRDYIYISDLCSHIESMITKGKRDNDISLMSSFKSYTVPQIYDIFCRKYGRRIEPFYSDPTSFWDKYPQLFDGTFPLSKQRVRQEVEKSTSLLGTSSVKCNITMEQGLEEIVKYIRNKK